MIQLLGFLILPAIGVIALAVKRLCSSIMSDEKIVFGVILATAFLFFTGLFLGFAGISINLVSSIDFAFTLETNGLSIPFMLLAVVLPALGLWSAHHEIKKNTNLFYIFYLLSYMSLIMIFISANLISFFIFWEVVLISFFFIIAFWGDEKIRKRASMKFLIFTQFGSLMLLGAFILMFLYTGSFDINVISNLASTIPSPIADVIFLFVLITAIVKMPIFPLHSWLPDAHVSAPTSGSVLLAGVLLKLGGYALLLFGVLLFPSITSLFQKPLIILGVFTAIYATFVASTQNDFKRLIAYSSIFYMALVFVGLASMSYFGESGAVLLMVSHGFIVGMLFVLAGILKKKTGTRDLNKLGGLMARMPVYTLFLTIAIIATLGVPGLSNFPAELLVFLGAYGAYTLSLVSLVGVLIATNYYLGALKRILFSSLGKTLSKVTDISMSDAIQLSLFTIPIIVLGIAPNLLMGAFNLLI